MTRHGASPSTRCWCAPLANGGSLASPPDWPCLRVRAGICPLTSELPGGSSGVTGASTSMLLAQSRSRHCPNGRGCESGASFRICDSGNDSPMLTELGVPDDLEGIVAIQVFKAGRAYATPSSLDMAGRGLDGAHLLAGELPDAYIQARILEAALRQAILMGTLGAGKPLEEHLRAAQERDTSDNLWRSRPMAVLVGWRATAVRQRTPVGEYDWADLGAEHQRGLELRAELHGAVGRLAVGLRLELGELLMDRVASHSFWVAPSHPPVIVLGEFIGSVEVTTGSTKSFPREEVEEWARELAAIPASLYDAIEEPLDLLAAARAIEPNWTRFTLGWGALERLATNVGSRFDSQITVEQRACERCGAPITSRRPGPRQRLLALVNALALPNSSDLAEELARLHDIRGASHGGTIPDGADLVSPERLAEQILRAIVTEGEKIPT